jgi:hypothetical protein
MAWSLATLSGSTPAAAGDAVEAISARLCALLPRLDARQLPVALWAVAALTGASRGRVSEGMSAISLLHASAHRLAAVAPAMSAQGVAMAAWAYASTKVRGHAIPPPPTCPAAASAVRVRQPVYGSW